MDQMTDQCYLDIANKTLKSQAVIREFETIEKGVAYKVTDEIITRRKKAEIRKEPLDEDAAYLMREALIDSKEATKLTIFLDVLQGSQKHHANKIEEIYKQNVQEHTCKLCNLLPATPENSTERREEEMQTDPSKQKEAVKLAVEK